MARATIDPVTLEILGNRLLSVAEEVGETLVKTAFSTNIKERRDCSSAVFDRHGNMIAQAEHIPMHLGSMLGCVQAVLERVGAAELRRGDVYVTNDPYSGGGTHLPDITMVSPAFADGELVGFVANIAHHADVGGKVPGSTSGDASSIFQEGVRIPISRLQDGGRLRADVMDFIRVNSRTPLERDGDLNAQLAANAVGVRRLEEVVARYGVARFAEVSAALLDYAETLMRAGIARLPDGRSSFTDHMDDDGITLGVPLPIRVTVIVEGDVATVDLTGSSPQVRGPINVPLNGTLATIFYCFKALVGPDIPSNSGIYRALQVHAPEGTILNCVQPAAVGERIDTCQRLADAIFGAMSAIVPDRVLAASNSSVTTATFSGRHHETGEVFVYLETIAGGSGAHASGDGLSGVQVHMTNTSNLPVEALEREYPIVVTRYRFRQDSGGAGEFRGGLGIEREFEALQDGIAFSGLGDRQTTPPWGLLGGEAGATGAFELRRSSGGAERLGSKVSDVTLTAGDRVAVLTPGAGGFGNPRARSPERVQRDIDDRRVSARAAADAYGVALVPGATSIDESLTQRLRAGTPDDDGE